MHDYWLAEWRKPFSAILCACCILTLLHFFEAKAHAHGRYEWRHLLRFARHFLMLLLGAPDADRRRTGFLSRFAKMAIHRHLTMHCRKERDDADYFREIIIPLQCFIIHTSVNATILSLRFLAVITLMTWHFHYHILGFWFRICHLLIMCIYNYVSWC